MPNILVQKPSTLSSMDSGGTVINPPQLLLPVKKPVIVKPVTKPVIVDTFPGTIQPYKPVDPQYPGGALQLEPGQQPFVEGGTQTPDAPTTGEKAQSWLKANWPWLAGAVGLIIAGIVIYKLVKK